MTTQPNPLAPALPVPTSLAALAPQVWPAHAARVDGELALGGIPVSTLARDFGTPLVVLDEAEVRDRARTTREVFERAASRIGTTATVYYAGKALLTADVARWVSAQGLGIDVCTQGELALALAAGTDPATIGVHGNNKLESEIDAAVQAGVGTIVLDSAIEIERVAEAAQRHARVQRVRLRVSVGVHAETHDFLATSHEDQKFGVALDDVPRLVARIRALPSLRFVGLHAHIGSQIFAVEGHLAAAERLLRLQQVLLQGGPVPELNLGGGFGIAYLPEDAPTDLALIADQLADFIGDECARLGIPVPHLAFEPGRAIVGKTGVTLYRVGTVKPVSVPHGDTLETRTYVSVDGGMSDNPRYALYGAQYTAALADRTGADVGVLARVVGRHCESGDIVVDPVYLPADIAPGDLLAVPATAAYTVSLSSTYNAVPRPAIVAVEDGAARVIVRRETIADLFVRDAGLHPEEPS